MNKHIQNLERLLQKMQYRYGADDDLVLQLNRELKRCEAGKPEHHAATAHGRPKRAEVLSSFSH